MFTLGAFAILFDSGSRVLLCRRRDFDAWNLPGGRIESGELPTEAVIRETREETGLEVEVERLVGVYGKPDKDDLVFSFVCRQVGGVLSQTDEAAECRWFAIDEIPSNTLSRQVERILDAKGDAGAPVFRRQTAPSSRQMRGLGDERVGTGEGQLKLLADMRREQHAEVERYRTIAARFVEQRLRPLPCVAGALLSGSAARGDARKGPLGFMIDVVAVLEEGSRLDPAAAFGETTDPELPFHCVRFEDEEIALEVRDLAYLRGVRLRTEAEMFARGESLVLYDRDGDLALWKSDALRITGEEVRERCLKHRARFRYVTGDYRNEKWSHRGAWLQVAQNLNEATECYCSFLHCLNGGFVPRKDWLVYLTWDMPLRPARHAQLMRGMYGSFGDERELGERLPSFREAGAWIEAVCRERGWI